MEDKLPSWGGHGQLTIGVEYPGTEEYIEMRNKNETVRNYGERSVVQNYGQRMQEFPYHIWPHVQQLKGPEVFTVETASQYVENAPKPFPSHYQGVSAGRTVDFIKYSCFSNTPVQHKTNVEDMSMDYGELDVLPRGERRMLSNESFQFNSIASAGCIQKFPSCSSQNTHHDQGQQLEAGNSSNWTSVIKEALEMSNGMELEQPLPMDMHTSSEVLPPSHYKTKSMGIMKEPSLAPNLIKSNVGDDRKRDEVQGASVILPSNKSPLNGQRDVEKMRTDLETNILKDGTSSNVEDARDANSNQTPDVKYFRTAEECLSSSEHLSSVGQTEMGTQRLFIPDTLFPIASHKESQSKPLVDKGESKVFVPTQLNVLISQDHTMGESTEKGGENAGKKTTSTSPRNVLGLQEPKKVTVPEIPKTLEAMKENGGTKRNSDGTARNSSDASHQNTHPDSFAEGVSDITVSNIDQLDQSKEKHRLFTVTSKESWSTGRSKKKKASSKSARSEEQHFVSPQESCVNQSPNCLPPNCCAQNNTVSLATSKTSDETSIEPGSVSLSTSHSVVSKLESLVHKIGKSISTSPEIQTSNHIQTATGMIMPVTPLTSFEYKGSKQCCPRQIKNPKKKKKLPLSKHVAQPLQEAAINEQDSVQERTPTRETTPVLETINSADCCPEQSVVKRQWPIEEDSSGQEQALVNNSIRIPTHNVLSSQNSSHSFVPEAGPIIFEAECPTKSDSTKKQQQTTSTETEVKTHRGLQEAEQMDIGMDTYDSTSIQDIVSDNGGIFTLTSESTVSQPKDDIPPKRKRGRPAKKKSIQKSESTPTQNLEIVQIASSEPKLTNNPSTHHSSSGTLQKQKKPRKRKGRECEKDPEQTITSCQTTDTFDLRGNIHSFTLEAEVKKSKTKTPGHTEKQVTENNNRNAQASPKLPAVKEELPVSPEIVPSTTVTTLSLSKKQKKPRKRRMDESVAGNDEYPKLPCKNLNLPDSVEELLSPASHSMKTPKGGGKAKTGPLKKLHVPTRVKESKVGPGQSKEETSQKDTGLIPSTGPQECKQTAKKKSRKTQFSDAPQKNSSGPESQTEVCFTSNHVGKYNKAQKVRKKSLVKAAVAVSDAEKQCIDPGLRQVDTFKASCSSGNGPGNTMKKPVKPRKKKTAKASEKQTENNSHIPPPSYYPLQHNELPLPISDCLIDNVVSSEAESPKTKRHSNKVQSKKRSGINTTSDAGTQIISMDLVQPEGIFSVVEASLPSFQSPQIKSKKPRKRRLEESVAENDQSPKLPCKKLNLADSQEELLSPASHLMKTPKGGGKAKTGPLKRSHVPTRVKESKVGPGQSKEETSQKDTGLVPSTGPQECKQTAKKKSRKTMCTQQFSDAPQKNSSGPESQTKGCFTSNHVGKHNKAQKVGKKSLVKAAVAVSDAEKQLIGPGLRQVDTFKASCSSGNGPGNTMKKPVKPRKKKTAKASEKQTENISHMPSPCYYPLQHNELPSSIKHSKIGNVISSEAEIPKTKRHSNKVQRKKRSGVNTTNNACTPIISMDLVQPEGIISVVETTSPSFQSPQTKSKKPRKKKVVPKEAQIIFLGQLEPEDAISAVESSLASFHGPQTTSKKLRKKKVVQSKENTQTLYSSTGNRNAQPEYAGSASNLEETPKRRTRKGFKMDAKNVKETSSVEVNAHQDILSVSETTVSNLKKQQNAKKKTNKVSGREGVEIKDENEQNIGGFPEECFQLPVSQLDVASPTTAIADRIEKVNKKSKTVKQGKKNNSNISPQGASSDQELVDGQSKCDEIKMEETADVNNSKKPRKKSSAVINVIGENDYSSHETPEEGVLELSSCEFVHLTCNKGPQNNRKETVRKPSIVTEKHQERGDCAAAVMSGVITHPMKRRVGRPYKKKTLLKMAKLLLESKESHKKSSDCGIITHFVKRESSSQPLKTEVTKKKASLNTRLSPVRKSSRICKIISSSMNEKIQDGSHKNEVLPTVPPQSLVKLEEEVLSIASPVSELSPVNCCVTPQLKKRGRPPNKERPTIVDTVNSMDHISELKTQTMAQQNMQEKTRTSKAVNRKMKSGPNSHSSVELQNDRPPETDLKSVAKKTNKSKMITNLSLEHGETLSTQESISCAGLMTDIEEDVQAKLVTEQLKKKDSNLSTKKRSGERENLITSTEELGTSGAEKDFTEPSQSHAATEKKKSNTTPTSLLVSKQRKSSRALKLIPHPISAEMTESLIQTASSVADQGCLCIPEGQLVEHAPGRKRKISKHKTNSSVVELKANGVQGKMDPLSSVESEVKDSDDKNTNSVVHVDEPESNICSSSISIASQEPSDVGKKTLSKSGNTTKNVTCSDMTITTSGSNPPSHSKHKAVKRRRRRKKTWWDMRGKSKGLDNKVKCDDTLELSVQSSIDNAGLYSNNSLCSTFMGKKAEDEMSSLISQWTGDEALDHSTRSVTLTSEVSPSSLDCNIMRKNEHISNIETANAYEIDKWTPRQYASGDNISETEKSEELPEQSPKSQKIDRFTQYAEEHVLANPTDDHVHQQERVLSKVRVKKPIKCKYCGQSFRHISAFTIHKRIHTGEKPYRCQKCGKTFAQLSKLKSHRNTHEQTPSLPCPCCSKQFSQRDDLVAHFRVHIQEPKCKQLMVKPTEDSVTEPYSHSVDSSVDPKRVNKLRCMVCNRVFLNKLKLNIHMLTHKQESLSCKHCGKKFWKSSKLLMHEKTHWPVKPYACSVCGRGFNKLKELKVHSHEHTGETPFSCSHCGHAFRHLTALRVHQASELCIAKKNVNEDDNAIESFLVHQGVDGQVNTPVFFKCQICKQRYQRWCQYTLHLQTHTKVPYLCFACGQSYEKELEIGFHCSMCCQSSGEEMVCGGSLSKIMERRQTYQNSPQNCETTLPCSPNTPDCHQTPVIPADSLCSLEKSTEPNNDQLSQTTQHSPPPEPTVIQSVIAPSECPSSGHQTGVSVDRSSSFDLDCNPPSPSLSVISCTSSNESLECIVVSTGLWRFECPRCGQRFKQYRALHSHIQTHAPGYRYTCGHCGQAFRRWNKLWLHQRLHQRKGRCFPCPHCSLQFRFFGSYKEHLFSHAEQRPYACPLCPQTFVFEESLNTHQCDNHQPVKTLRCDVCAKMFSSLRNLTRHSLLHNGIASHQCLLCNLSFTNSRILQDHLKTHNNQLGLPIPDVRSEPFSFPHQCKKCKASFSAAELLYAHQICHRRQANNFSSPMARNVSTSGASDEPPQSNPGPASSRSLLSTLDLSSIPDDDSLYIYPHPDRLYVIPSRPVARPQIIRLDFDEDEEIQETQNSSHVIPDTSSAPISEESGLETGEPSEVNSQTGNTNLPQASLGPESIVSTDLSLDYSGLSQPQTESTITDLRDTTNIYQGQVMSSRLVVAATTTVYLEWDDDDDTIECADCCERFLSVSELHGHYVQHASGLQKF